uniref:Nucleotide-diphospho-sugar transferase domain-containing protein n=1 Tax=Chrysotila carterae TaxID=13221 RepID=A0A7S4AYS5_CHRCT
MPCVLALGRLNESTLRRDESCTEATLKVHVGYKALVLLALFQRYPKLSGAMYMDADAVIDAAWLRPQVYFELEPRADLIGTSNFNAPVLMNGGVLLLRNSPWTARFLSQWWQRRCAGKDQLALWHSIFAAWAEDIPWLRWPKGMWSKYKYALDAARRLALPYVASSHNAMRRALLLDNTEWKCNGTCNWLFERTGCLSQPLFLPHVLLLPVVPFRLPKGASHTISDGEVLSRLRARSSSLVPPLQHYSGHLYARFTGLAAEQLVCHVNERPSSCLHQQQGTQGLQHINLTKRDKRHLREMCDLCRTFARSIVDGRCSNRTHNKFYRCVCSNVLLPKFENVASGEGSFRHRWRCPDICLHLGSKL